MKGISTNPRVLLCTTYRRFPGDYMNIAGQSIYKAGAPCRISPGLRFIKQNVPEVEILEYPMWHEYVAELKKGWDVVGFSFYQIHIGEIIEMIEEARRHGVREIWAGNYGVLDYKVPSLVDRVFIGPAEDQIAQVFGYRVRDEDIEHPVMVAHLSSALSVRHLAFGLLYTAHGCPYTCTFCQTPIFERRRFTINLRSIRRVLAYYSQLGIDNIGVTDELFGIYPSFTDELTRLFASYKFRWWAQSRASLFLRHLDTWYERGLRLPAIGVEAMIQCALDEVNKKLNTEETQKYARRTHDKPGMFRIGFYMIGYENMTLEETIQDAIRLKKLGFDSHGVRIITPFPRTPLWEKLTSQYGIFDHTYRHYDDNHLVWNHPLITPIKMQNLLKFLRGFLNKPIDIYRKILKRLVWEELRLQGPRFLWKTLMKGPISSLFINDRKQVFFPKLEKSKT